MEGQINIHIVPLAARICDALTTAYLKPALKTLGEDEDRYVYWYDTAPLTVRPERLKDTREMYNDGLVSKAAVLLAGDYKISDAPSVDEDLEKFTRELMLRDPNLFQIPAIRKVAGYTEEILPADTVVTPQTAGPGMPGAGPPPPPAPPTGISATPGGPIPQQTEAINAPGGPPSPPAITASASTVNTFFLANATVLRAMELAGKRLLTSTNRDRWPDTPPHELHTKIHVKDQEHAKKLLSGAWDHLSVLASHMELGLDTTELQQSLDVYCTTLLCREKSHQPALLGEFLRLKGFLDGD
jgi:hypothetical protein